MKNIPKKQSLKQETVSRPSPPIRSTNAVSRTDSWEHLSKLSEVEETTEKEDSLHVNLTHTRWKLFDGRDRSSEISSIASSRKLLEWRRLTFSFGKRRKSKGKGGDQSSSGNLLGSTSPSNPFSSSDELDEKQKKRNTADYVLHSSSQSPVTPSTSNPVSSDETTDKKKKTEKRFSAELNDDSNPHTSSTSHSNPISVKDIKLI